MINEAEKIIKWYAGFSPNDPGRDLSHLLRARRKLACLSVELAKECSELKGRADGAEFARKYNYAKAMEGYRKSEGSVAAAEIKAEIDIAKFRKAEGDAQQAYQLSRLLLSQVNEILNSLSGDIRNLENEYRRIGQTETT